jgi:hypothetical protein
MFPVLQIWIPQYTSSANPTTASESLTPYATFGDVSFEEFIAILGFAALYFEMDQELRSIVPCLRLASISKPFHFIKVRVVNERTVL